MYRSKRRGDYVPGRLPFRWEEELYNRTAVLIKAAESIEASRYLEIGCASDEVFKAVTCPYKVGVDPNHGGTLRLTSDEFFAQNSERFDLIYIDGLHHYPQAKRDIEHALDILNTGGVIAVHDCLPLCWENQVVPRWKSRWNGDVWKAIFDFKIRPDIDLRVVTVDEGIGLIRVQPNTQLGQYAGQNMADATFAFFLEYYQSLGLISFEEIEGFLTS
jgi:hypothetical protein